MNIIFDNVIFSKEKQGGISNYWYELIKNYSDNSNAYFFEEKGASDNIFRKKLVIKNLVPHFQLPLPLARLLPIKYSTKTDKVLYHSSFYRKLNTKSKVCEITTVHDFIHNKYSAPANRLLHNRLKYGSIKRACGIICISQNTLLDLKKYCPPRKEQKVAVIYNGVSDDYKPVTDGGEEFEFFLNKLGINNKFLLFVGARSNYKNFLFALELLDQLPEYNFVVVGNALTESEKATTNKRLLDRIVVASGISNAHLNILYNNAHALLYPSSYEGFGIPVIEAMKAGCPVFAINSSSIPEVSGNAAMLFDNLNVTDFVKGIRMLEHNDKRIELVNGGFENAKRFDWSKCVKETVEFYATVCN